MWFFYELLQGFHEKVLRLYAIQAEISGLRPEYSCFFLVSITIQAVQVNCQRGVAVKC